MCFFFNQKPPYELRISDWSSDVCSSDLVRVDATMDEQPLGSRHLVDDAADLVGLLNGQELFLPARGNEGKHHHVGVGIEEDILDELLGAAEAGLSKTVLADEVSLHVEYELPAAEAIERRVRIDRRDLVQLKEAAGPPGSGVRSVEGEQRADRKSTRLNSSH